MRLAQRLANQRGKHKVHLVKHESADIMSDEYCTNDIFNRHSPISSKYRQGLVPAVGNHVVLKASALSAMKPHFFIVDLAAARMYDLRTFQIENKFRTSTMNENRG